MKKVHVEELTNKKLSEDQTIATYSYESKNPLLTKYSKVGVLFPYRVEKKILRARKKLKAKEFS